MNTGNIESGLTTAKTGILAIIKFVVNNIASPLLSAALIGLIVFLVFSSIQMHHQGEDYSKRVYMIIGAVIVLALVSTFPVWGWQLIGG